ncbi:MAG: THUMP domain-containing protein, partial [Candidatus Thermoplasmatota archaeon]|nr:THUMP domain-containing protein [Candidatus Thermoplasmatota archaeon]
ADAGEEKTMGTLRRVFGITSMSPVTETTSKPEGIIKVALELSKNLTKDKSFGIRCKRTGNHDYSSQQLAAQVGDAVNNATGASVNLENPDFEISLDVRDKKAYIFTERVRCAGGMPLGTQGIVIARICNENDLLAAWLLMKRGAEAIAAGNAKYFEILEKWGLNHSIKVEMPSYGELEKLALENNADAIVVGEKFGELKSKQKETALPILRPLVGMGDEWIQRKISSIKSQ